MDVWMEGRGRGRKKERIEAKRRDVTMPVGMESPCLTR